MKAALALLAALPLLAQETIVLRPAPAGAPPEQVVERGTAGVVDRAISNVSEPTLTLYRPATPNGAALVICPGGGYARLAIDKEGHDIARWLQSLGYTTLVLKYRLPGSMKGSMDSLAAATEAARLPIEDASDAIRAVRARAAELHLKPHSVGLMGFSAGGHLGFMAGLAAPEARPDFLVLGYPALPKFDALPATFPPSFLVHANDDPGVPPEATARLYVALKALKRPAELHIYSSGGHGFGMKKTQATSAAWPDALRLWLAELLAR